MKNIIILASSSPRRQKILKQVQIPFTVRVASVDESKIYTTDPTKRVEQLAKLKNKSMSLKHENEIILTADTIVSHNNIIFEKPKNKQEAYEMIFSMSGQIHDVYTGVMLRSAHCKRQFVEQTKVQFWPLTKKEIKEYIDTEEPYDKAGAYGIQSVGAKFVKQIVGDYYNVVGLPISRLVQEIKRFDL